LINEEKINMSASQILPLNNETHSALTNTLEPLRMDVIEQIAAMAEGTERPALIWGNTDRDTAAAEALWFFARRVGLNGRGDDAFTAVQDLIANLMHLCEQEDITGGEVSFASLVSMAEMHYIAELDESIGL
jgi:hypothetical protein